MSEKILERSATIETVLPTLRERENYLCGVLKHMTACTKVNGDAFVRIGITGKGRYPAYRVEYPKTMLDLKGNSIRSIDTGYVFGAYGGQNHSKFQDVQIQELTWSNVPLRINDVKRMLGETRALKKIKP